MLTPIIFYVLSILYIFTTYCYLQEHGPHTYKNSHLHKFHLHSDKDLHYGVMGNKSVAVWQVSVNNFEKHTALISDATSKNLKTNNGRCKSPYQQRTPPRP
jgi:hypothetical protein